MRAGGPWIAASLICAGWEREDEGPAMISGIGSAIHLPGRGIVPVTLCVLITGGVAGEHVELGVEREAPTGDRRRHTYALGPFGSHPNAVIDATIVQSVDWPMPGVYWFRFNLDGALKSELPFHAIFDAGKVQT